MREAGEKTKAISRHRLCLIVPLAIQLSLPVVLIEIPIAEKIRLDAPLELQAYFAIPYYIALLATLFWLPIYVIRNRKNLGSTAKRWMTLTGISSVLTFLMLVYVNLPRL